MGKQSRETDILELFYNYPTKHWHFGEIKEHVPIADNKVSRWLKSFTKSGLVKRHKPRGSMPYYTSDYENPEYQNRKRLYALQKLHQTGLLNHLSSLKKAESVILFGSMTRWDWYKESDVDVFIYGDPEGLEIAEFELKLHREIQLFICKDREGLKKFGKGLIRNIIKGDLIKGSLDFIEVDLNA